MEENIQPPQKEPLNNSIETGTVKEETGKNGNSGDDEIERAPSAEDSEDHEIVKRKDAIELNPLNSPLGCIEFVIRLAVYSTIGSISVIFLFMLPRRLSAVFRFIGERHGIKPILYNSGKYFPVGVQLYHLVFDIYSFPFPAFIFLRYNPLPLRSTLLCIFSMIAGYIYFSIVRRFYEDGLLYMFSSLVPYMTFGIAFRLVTSKDSKVYKHFIGVIVLVVVLIIFLQIFRAIPVRSDSGRAIAVLVLLPALKEITCSISRFSGMYMVLDADISGSDIVNRTVAWAIISFPSFIASNTSRIMFTNFSSPAVMIGATLCQGFIEIVTRISHGWRDEKFFELRRKWHRRRGLNRRGTLVLSGTYKVESKVGGRLSKLSSNSAIFPAASQNQNEASKSFQPNKASRRDRSPSSMTAMSFSRKHSGAAKPSFSLTYESKSIADTIEEIKQARKNIRCMVIISDMIGEYQAIFLTPAVIYVFQNFRIAFPGDYFDSISADSEINLMQLFIWWISQLTIEIITDTICCYHETRHGALLDAVWNGRHKGFYLEFLATCLMSWSVAFIMVSFTNSMAECRNMDVCCCYQNGLQEGGAMSNACLSIYNSSAGLPSDPQLCNASNPDIISQYYK